MATILDIQGLTKHFRDPWTFRRLTVLHGLDLRVEEGEIFGLIGHNGAGKTTTFKLLLGFLRPSAGHVTFCDRPLDAAARAGIGFLPEQPYFYDYLTVEEMLGFYASLYGLTGTTRRRRVAEVIEAVRLGHKQRASLRTLSKGLLQRVGIAQAILNRPRLLILDEPMSGLDPAGRAQMRDLIRAQQQAGTTVIFSSHILPDAEALCSRVGILARGTLRDVVDLRERSGATTYLLAVRSASAETLETLARLAGSPPLAEGTTWRVRLPGAEAVAAALDAVRATQATVESLLPVHPTLEERFLAHTKDLATTD